VSVVEPRRKLEVDGFVVDARSMPLAVQQVAFEKGLIPYIPVLQALDVDSSAG
jgi:hypothetical protein